MSENDTEDNDGMTKRNHSGEEVNEKKPVVNDGNIDYSKRNGILRYVQNPEAVEFLNDTYNTITDIEGGKCTPEDICLYLEKRRLDLENNNFSNNTIFCEKKSKPKDIVTDYDRIKAVLGYMENNYIREIIGLPENKGGNLSSLYEEFRELIDKSVSNGDPVFMQELIYELAKKSADDKIKHIFELQKKSARLYDHELFEKIYTKAIKILKEEKISLDDIKKNIKEVTKDDKSSAESVK